MQNLCSTPEPLNQDLHPYGEPQVIHGHVEIGKTLSIESLVQSHITSHGIGLRLPPC